MTSSHITPVPPIGFLKKTSLRMLAAWRGADKVWYDTIWRKRETRAVNLLAAGVSAAKLKDYQIMHALDKAPAIFRLALAAGANPNARELNNYHDAAIHRAARKSDIASVRALIEAGAELENRDGKDYTALLAACDIHFAIHFARTKQAADDMATCAKLLLKAGADPEAKTELLQTALGMATTTELAEVLLEGGAPLDATDRDEVPAFHSACRAVTGDNAKRWLAACQRQGADINAPAADGISLTQRIIKQALEGNYNYGLDTMNRRAIDIQGNAIYRPDQTENILEVVLGAGGHIDAVDAQGRNALHRMAPGGDCHIPAVIWLIRQTRGAIMRQADSNGFVPEIHALATLKDGCDQKEKVRAALAEVDAEILDETLPTSPLAVASGHEIITPRRRARF